MKHLWVGLFVVALILTYSKSTAAESYGIIQIDTGTTKAFHGKLNMEKTCKECWDPHGTDMAEALSDELESRALYPVNAKEIVWRTQLDVIRGVREAIKHQPKVIAMSLSGEDYNQYEREAVLEATSHGILVLAAAGNEGRAFSGYPGAYSMDCLVSVSTKEFGFKFHSANSGSIYIPRHNREVGTSYSTARAAGIAYSYWERNPKATCKQVEAYLKNEFGPTQLERQ